MRIVKDHEVRKAEFIEVADRLFREKGYEFCTVKDIVSELNLARGTFFYYFPTKESVLDEIIRVKTEKITKRCLQISKMKSLTREERFINTLMSVNSVVATEESTEPTSMHQDGNALMHKKSMTALIQVLTPILTDIVVQEDEEISLAFIENNIMILLSSALILLDDGFFSWDEEKKGQILFSILRVAEKLLGLSAEKMKEALEKDVSMKPSIEQ